MGRQLTVQAVRLAQDLSLHKEDSYYYLEDTEEAQWKARRRYVLWVCAYLRHDCDTVVRMGSS